MAKAVITVVLESKNDLDSETLGKLAQKIESAISGKALSAAPANERSCDGIDIGGFVCIGKSTR